MRSLIFATTLAVLSGVGCGGTTPPPAPAAAEPAMPPLGPLPMLVPEGADVIVVGRPAELLRSDAVRTVVDVVAPPALLDAFARRTGVEPTEVESLVVAEYEDGFLLLARGPWDARDVVRANEQLMNRVEVVQDEPFFRRAGWFGNDRRELAALADDVLLVASGIAEPLAALFSRARRGDWPGGRRPALAAEATASLVESHAEPPLVVFLPEPLALPPGFDASLLFARQKALALTVQPHDSTDSPVDERQLAFEVDLRGEFPEGAADNLRSLVRSVAETDLGAALGINEAAQTLSVQVEQGSVVLRFRVPAPVLARGLAVLFTAELEELLDPP